MSKTITLGVDVQVNSKSFKELQKGLNDVIIDLQSLSTKNSLDKTLSKSTEEAKKLQQVLNGAWDSKLNQLDMSKFNMGLKSAGVSAQNVKNILSGYPDVYERFSRTIIEGNTQLKQTNKLLDKMAVTMANTVRFGISSSIFNNLTNSIQKAYDYTLKLDKSLNDIRIVSDASAESMVKFAKYANDSAKKLGASTLDYTKGALIYFQQGLSEDEVIKRTDTTIKMSNALGASTEQVSSYMTAIWNNFGKGAENLEYYGDVITALGASTASSAAEIAGGLEKFAAVGETIGLSYEYATSALATIVAVTRQSEDTVGNSLKTIFARIQGLSLGETLEDGTTLNKYSEALAKVGVSIKTESGELKDMDTILNELGQTWGTLTKAEQTALAQTVAGVRQYNQLMALMNNWGSFQKNLNTAYNSTGTLAHQQDIYLDSLEAHLQKLSTEWEKTYSIIFDPDTIKAFADVATTALSGLNSLLTGLGGGLGTILNLGVQLSNLFSNQIGTEIFRQMSNSALQTEETLKQIAIMNVGSDSSKAYKEEEEILKKIKDIKSVINNEEYQSLINNMKTVGDYQDLLDKIETQRQQMETDLNSEIFKNPLTSGLQKDSTAEEWHNVLLDVNDRIHDIQKSTEEETEELKQLKELRDKIIENEKRAEKISHEDEYRTEQNILKGNVDLVHKQKLEQMEVQQFVRGTTAAASLLGVALGTVSTLTNDNLTKWEKAKAVMANLANMALLVARNWESLKGLGSVFSNFASGIAKGAGQTSAKMLSILPIKKATKAENDNTIAKKANAGASKEAVAGDIAEIASKEGVTKASKKATEESAKAAAGSKIMGVSAKEASGGVAALGASLGALIPYLIAIAAVVVIAAQVYYELNKAEIENVKEQKRLQDAVDKTTEAYKKANEEYNNLLNTVSNYQSAIDGINKLEEGTLEWYQAIQKANAEAQELIERWDLLAGSDYTIGAGGQIQINQEAIDRESYKEIQKLYSAMADQSLANYKLQKYNIDKEQRQITQEFKRSVNQQISRENPNAIISRNQAEQILKNINKTNIAIGPNETIPVNILKQLDNNQNNDIKDLSNIIKAGNETVSASVINSGESINITSKENTIDITESVAKWGAQYQANQFKEATLYNTYARNDLYAVASKQQIQDFESLGTLGQNVVLSELAAILENNREYTNAAIEAYVEKGSDEAWHDAYVSFNPLKAGASVVKGLGYDLNWGGVKDKRRQEAEKNASELLSNLDAEPIKEVFQEIKNISTDVYNKGYSGTNQKYITDLIYAIRKDYDITQKDLKLLTSSELSMVKQNFAENQNQALIDNEGNITWNYAASTESRLQQATRAQIANTQASLINNNRMKNAFAEDGNDAIVQYYEQQIQGDLSLLNTLVDQYNQYEELRQRSINSEAYDQIIALENEQNVLRDEWGRTIERQKADLIDYNNILKNQAETLGTSKEALDFYAIAMEGAGDIVNNHSAETAEAIAQQYKFNKQYNKAVSIYEDNKEAIEAYNKALKNNENISYEVADAMGEVSLALKEMGLSLSAETISSHLPLINQLLTGTEEEARAAYEQLLNLAQIDILKSLFGNSEQLVSQYEDIVNHINSLEPGANMDAIYADKLRNMINDTNLTVAQIQELASQLHIDIPVEYSVPDTFGMKDVHFTTAAKSTTHTYSGEMPNPAYSTDNPNAPRTIPIEYAWVETVEAKDDSFTIPEGTNFKVTNTNVNLAKGANLTKSPSNSKKSGSSSKPKKVELTKDKSDRYHKVNTQIEKTSNNLDKLEKAEEKALGGDWVDNLTKQFEQLNAQINNYNEKLRIAHGEQAELRAQLAAQGVTFNADGTIANYNAIFDAQLAQLNALEAQYNSLSAKQQEIWDNNKTIDTAKENFNQFKENLNRYDELVSNFIPNIEKQIQEAIDEMVSKQIEKFSKGIELRLDMSGAERDWNKFKAKVIDGLKEDDILGQTVLNIDNLSTYFTLLPNLIQHAEAIMEEMPKNVSEIYGEEDIKKLEDLRKYYEQLMKQTEDMFDLNEDIHKSYLSMMDEAKDKLDEQEKIYETISDLINHDMKVLELVYGKNAYDKFGQYYDKQHNNYLEQLDLLRQQKEMWENELNKATTDEERERAKNNWISVVKEIGDVTEKAIQNDWDRYVNDIEDIVYKWNDHLTSGKGLDYVNTEWQLMEKQADQYLDTVNQLFETQALENKYLDAIDQTDNIAAQKQIKEIMDEELTILKQKDKLTQYDIDRANKRYEIALKQIALEEAQQSKSTMRLRRDSQGNYRYEYVADNDAIDKARDELEKLKNDLYNFDKAQYQDSLNEMYDTWVEFQDALKDAAQINDPEERAAKEALIKKEYGNTINNMLAENDVIRRNLEQSAFEDLAILYNEDVKKFTNMTDKEKKALMGDLVPAWDSGIQEMITTMTSEGGFYRVCENAFDEIGNAQDKVVDGFEEISDAAGESIEDIADGIDTNISKVQSFLETNSELVGEYVTNFDKLREKINNIGTTFKQMNEDAAKTLEAMKQILNTQDEENAEAYDEAAADAQNDHTITDIINENNNPITETTPVSGGDGIPNIGDSNITLHGPYHLDSTGKNPNNNQIGTGGFTIMGDVSSWGGKYKYPYQIGRDGIPFGWVRLEDISGYDTGGYTGSWGNNGRLAMLHQKELVLNAQDTENMLNAINVMRNLTNSVGITTLARLASLGAGGNASTSGNGLEQNVHITATFPNATSSREIEDALLNLTNKASQYIGRR